MANLFFDTNFFIDIVEERKIINMADFLNHTLFLSPLSIHKLTDDLEKYFSLISIDKKLATKALEGPTSD